jgi:hypothetical protein
VLIKIEIKVGVRLLVIHYATYSIRWGIFRSTPIFATADPKKQLHKFKLYVINYVLNAIPRRTHMKTLKKFVVLATLSAMIGVSAHQLTAQEYCTEAGGYGYEQACRVPSIAPAIALGTIALVAIIAVAVQNSSHHEHGHSHSH